MLRTWLLAIRIILSNEIWIRETKMSFNWAATPPNTKLHADYDFEAMDGITSCNTISDIEDFDLFLSGQNPGSTGHYDSTFWESSDNPPHHDTGVDAFLPDYDSTGRHDSALWQSLDTSNITPGQGTGTHATGPALALGSPIADEPGRDDEATMITMQDELKKFEARLNASEDKTLKDYKE